MDFEARVNQYYRNLNESDKEIVSYILENKNSVTDMTITTLANLLLTSKSSVLRLTKKLGYSGYSEFKYDLRNQLTEHKANQQNIVFTDLQDNEIENTKKLFRQIDLGPILQKIHSSKRIFCYGTGWGQRTVLTNFIRSVIPLEKFPVLLASLAELEMTTRTMTEEDLLIVVSLSGDIKEAEHAMKSLVLRKIPILSITELRNNDYASLAMYNLYYQVSTVDYKETEITSLFPLYLITDLLFREYTEYVTQVEQNK